MGPRFSVVTTMTVDGYDDGFVSTVQWVEKSSTCFRLGSASVYMVWRERLRGGGLGGGGSRLDLREPPIFLNNLRIMANARNLLLGLS